MQATKKTVIAALIGNAIIAIFKFVAAIFTQSSSILAEAYHSASDTFNQIFLLLGIKLSKKKATELHPFGFAKEQYFWSFVVAVILFGVAGILSFTEGIHKITHPQMMTDVYWSYAAIILGLFLDGYALRLAYKQVRKTMKEEKFDTIFQAIKQSKDPTVLTVLFEDSLAVTGLMVAAIGITLSAITKNPLYDSLGSIVIGVLLMVFALLLGYEVKKLIIGESITRRKKIKIREIALSFPEVREVLSLKTMHLSPETVIVGLELKFKGNLMVSELEKITDKIEKRIKKIIPQAKCYIEAENEESD
jgi:cation diffusion facilitator family transporter